MKNILRLLKISEQKDAQARDKFGRTVLRCSEPELEYLKVRKRDRELISEIQAIYTTFDQSIKVRSSQDVYRAYRSYFNNIDVEEFWILVLNRANNITKRILLSSGGRAGTVVDVREAVKRAIIVPASSSVILVHNHPSGNINPSQADKHITRRLSKAFESVDMKVLDHIVFGDGYFSFADHCII